MKTYVFGEGSRIEITARAPLHATHATCTSVSGGFTASLEGSVPNGEVTGWAGVEVKAFKSGNRLLEMNTLRHIGARRHPTARFEISSVEVVAEEPDTRVRVAGTMAFHGTVREIEAEPTVTAHDGTVTVAGTWTLRQSDFGLKPPRLAMLKVEDDIEVDFRLVATKEGK
jgi:hypothetical protein